MYIVFYWTFYPEPTVRCPVFFNFVTTPPVAKLDLTNIDRQWSFYPRRTHESTEFLLKPDGYYDFSIEYYLILSPRNDIGMFSSEINLVDSNGDLVAHSIRSFALPFKSPLDHFVDSIVKYPVSLWTNNWVKRTKLQFEMINDFQESSVGDPPLAVVELILHPEKVDLQDAYLSIVPKVQGIKYVNYYYSLSNYSYLIIKVNSMYSYWLKEYPIIFALLFIGTLSTWQVWLYSLLLMVRVYCFNSACF